jgi:pSer/pThr/pTyr-binding forkhead associated (FHA) protein
VKFEVRYPTGASHEVELSGTVATLGRDPASDLVLNDAKCSRRHAVVEAGPEGIAIRDAGSANGIFVNGKKVERAPLVAGDVVRLGEVTLKVLAEEVAGTLVMAAEDIDDFGGTRPVRPSPPDVTPPPSAPRVPTPLPPAPAVSSAPTPMPPKAPPAPPPPAHGDRRPSAPAPAAAGRRSDKTLLVFGLVGCLLLIVLAVVAILAVIFIPAYLRSRDTRVGDEVYGAGRPRAVAAAPAGALRTPTAPPA